MKKKKCSGNRIFAKICEINNFEYSPKLIYTEIFLKICYYIYTTRFLTSSSIQLPKNKHYNQLLEINFNYS